MPPSMHQAAIEGNDVEIAHALDHNVHVEHRSADGYTALHLATMHEHAGAVALLLAAGAEPNGQTKAGRSALHIASCLGHEKIVEYLLTANADITLPDFLGKTARDLVDGSSKRVIRMLEGGSPDEEVDGKRSDLGVSARGDSTSPVSAAAIAALLEAAADGDLDVIEAHAHIIHATKSSACSALHAAVSRGQLFATNMLLREGADVNAQGAFLNAPLHSAVKGANLHVVNLLLARHADCDALNGDGATPLALAQMLGLTEVAKLLTMARTDHGMAQLKLQARRMVELPSPVTPKYVGGPRWPTFSSSSSDAAAPPLAAAPNAIAPSTSIAAASPAMPSLPPQLPQPPVTLPNAAAPSTATASSAMPSPQLPQPTVTLSPQLSPQEQRTTFFEEQQKNGRPAVYVTGYADMDGHVEYVIETEVIFNHYRSLFAIQHRMKAFRRLAGDLSKHIQLPSEVQVPSKVHKWFQTEAMKTIRVRLLQQYLRAAVNACTLPLPSSLIRFLGLPLSSTLTHSRPFKPDLCIQLSADSPSSSSSLPVPAESPSSADCAESTATVAVTTAAAAPSPAMDEESSWVMCASTVVHIRELGCGASSTVYEVSCGDSPITLAAKNIRFANMTQRDSVAREIRKEFRVLMQLQHPNIVRLRGLVLDDPGSISLIMELSSLGTLSAYLASLSESERSLTNDEQQPIMNGIVSAMTFLHSRAPPILHHDLKTDNVLLWNGRDIGSSDHIVPKLADFGLATGSGMSTRRAGATRARGISTKTGPGTLVYAAPECFESNSVYTTASEVYAFAIICWEIATAKVAWQGMGYHCILNNVVCKHERPALTAEEATSPAGRLATRCWAHDAEERPSFDLLNEECEELLPDVSSPHQNRFIAPLLVLGTAMEAARGLHERLGLTDVEVAEMRLRVDDVTAVRDEFVHNGGDGDLEMVDYILNGTAQETVPATVQSDIAAGQYHGGPLEAEDFDYGHHGMVFSDFANLDEAKTAELGRAHVLVLRLYTSSAHQRLNAAMRRCTKPNPFARTAVCLSEAIRRLQRVEVCSRPWSINETVHLYRGLKNMREPDAFALSGGCEHTPISTSADQRVAAAYAQSRNPLLLRFRSRGLNRGVSLQFLSLYPKEQEYVFPPLTFLAPDQVPEVLADGVIMWTVEPQLP